MRDDDYRLGRLNGEFVVVFYEQGPKGKRRRRYRLGTHDPQEARAARREFIRQREALESDPSRITIGQMWGDYIADRTAEGKATVSRMKDAWKAMGGHFGSLTLPDLIDGGEVRAYIGKRRRTGRSDGTINTELGYLRAALRKSGKRRGIVVIPDITLPPKPRPKDRWLTEEEAQRLLAAAVMPHMKLYILVALFTAGRPSSILDLTWDRVDFKRRQIKLDNPDRDRTAKGRATVPMADELVEPLERAKKGAQTEYVIEWGGEKIASIKRGVVRAAQRASLEGVTPYVLRHTAGVWMAEGGVPMEQIKDYFGHTSVKVTERVYAKFSPEFLRTGAVAIGARLGKKHRGQKFAEPVGVKTKRTKQA
jgi:integrase